MKILHIGADYGTTYQRKQALKRLGHDVTFVDPFTFLPSNRWMAKWIFETGAYGLEKRVERQVLEQISGQCFELALVDGGYTIGPDLVKALKAKTGYVVNYINDDPFPRSGWRKWRLYRKCIPDYDLLVVVREQNIEEVKLSGAKNVLHVLMTADEVAHKPIQLTDADRAAWASQVVFVGTWMPERGPFMARLLERGVPLSIWGDRWHKAREWRQIKHVWRGPSLYNEDYNHAIQAARICLGLLSEANRDSHTQRSAEIPAMGGLFCAKRTTEHERMYRDRQEAVFWNDADDCAEICLELLQSPTKCSEIAANGHKRCLENNYFNEPMLKKIIEHAMKDKDALPISKG
jgi:spore maturation protein CgeB